MGWVRKVAIGMGAVGGGGPLVCLVGGLFLPADLELSTARRVAAQPDTIRHHLTGHPGVAAWWMHAAQSMPSAMPELAVTHLDGPTQGVGCVVGFESGGYQVETWTLDEIGPDEVVWTVDFGIMKVERTFSTVAETAGGTLVGWHETGRIGNPFIRWLPILMSEEEVITNFDAALAALDNLTAPPERAHGVP